MSRDRGIGPSTRRLLLAGLLLGSLGLAGPAAAQQERLQVEHKKTDTSTPGRVRVTVGLSGQPSDAGVLRPSAFTATMDGRPATVSSAQPLESVGGSVAVVLVIDTSLSMQTGDNIGKARDAALRFAAAMRKGTRVGVVRFSSEPEIVQELTTDRELVRQAVTDLQAEGDTALFDAVGVASRMLAAEPGQRNLVVLSDGADTDPRATLTGAIAATKKANATVYSIGLTGPEQDQGALRRLAGTKDRAVVDVAGAELSGLFARLGQQIASQYVVDVQLPPGTDTSVTLQLTVRAGELSGSLRRPLILDANATRPTVLGPRDPRPAPGLSRLESAESRYVIAILVFGAALLVGLLLLRPRSRGGRPYRALRQRLSPYSLTQVIADDRRPTAFGSSELAGRATAMAESLVRRGNLEETFLDRLEAAGLNMRVAEFLLISLGSAFVPPLLVLAVTRNLLVTVLVVLLGTVGPFLYLAVRASRRQAKFEEQLPSTLQLLAGALQAGHSLQQAVDTVVHEAGDPIASEFHRVLTEARLGRPLEEAFAAMAKRTRSIDFEWTVMAINLQRQVGGNLAEVLGTVAQTIRDRYSLKRQIRALSAEGRLSSLILTVLPVLLFLGLLVLNPEFLAPLYTTGIGVIMLAAAGVLMIVGVFWMKKLTEIKV